MWWDDIQEPIGQTSCERHPLENHHDQKETESGIDKDAHPTRAMHAPGRSGDSGTTPFSQFDWH